MDWSKNNRGRLFKNHVGTAFLYAGKKISYGLGKGTSDLIGFEYIKIHELNTAPVFCAVEIKTVASPRLTSLQKNFLNYIKSIGGRAYIARENDENYSLSEYVPNP